MTDAMIALKQRWQKLTPEQRGFCPKCGGNLKNEIVAWEHKHGCKKEEASVLDTNRP